MSDPDVFTPAPPKAGARALRNGLEWVAIVAGALIVAFVVKTFLIQAFYIPSPSMEDTLMVGDRVLVNKLSYRLHQINRGDIVVFERPAGDAGEAGEANIKDLIKRVVGLEGDTVEGRDGKVVVNGRELREPYLPAGAETPDFSPRSVPQGHIFVMGDNRTNSKDSRFFGPITEDLVVGRAFVRVWPATEFELL